MQIIDGSTRITGILGYPIKHTFSPAMHNAAFKALNLNYVYLPFQVHPGQLKEAIRGMRALGIVGANVTVPFKQEVIKYLDALSGEAESIGAVNTVCQSNGKLIGYNTDGAGFIASLKEAGIEPAGKVVCLIGAGGAGRAVAVALAQAGIERIFISDLVMEKACELVKTIERNFDKIYVESIEGDKIKKILPISSILINATPVGMQKDEPSPIHPELLHPDLVVCDLVYNPPETNLLKEAKKRGAKVLNGLGMLLHQGALSFNKWTNLKPPLDIMRKALEDMICTT
jgi:shikimate dehydrogenase